MSIIKRTYDRLTGVLGYDCDGKRLRKGDLVKSASTASPSASNCHLIVLRRGDRADRYMDAWLLRIGFTPYMILLNPDGLPIWAGGPNAMRKVPRSENEPDWQNVERATGWKPQVRKVEHG